MPIDLPYHDARFGLEDHGALTRETVSGIADQVVLVGHSVGGLVAPLAASLPNVTRVVELCAIVPVPGRSVMDMHTDPGPDGDPTHLPAEAMPVDAQGNMTLPSQQALHEYFYQDCDESIAAWAWGHVVSMGPRIRADASPLTEWPDRPVTIIQASEDLVVSPAYSRRVAQRLGAELVEVDGSHSPYASRPDELAGILAKYAG
jgi:pimeloyl-ACP methyl ester carboxylesterase